MSCRFAAPLQSKLFMWCLLPLNDVFWSTASFIKLSLATPDWNGGGKGAWEHSGAGWDICLCLPQEASTELLQTQTNHRCHTCFSLPLSSFILVVFDTSISLRVCVTKCALKRGWRMPEWRHALASLVSFVFGVLVVGLWAAVLVQVSWLETGVGCP